MQRQFSVRNKGTVAPILRLRTLRLLRSGRSGCGSHGVEAINDWDVGIAVRIAPVHVSTPLRYAQHERGLRDQVPGQALSGVEGLNTNRGGRHREYLFALSVARKGGVEALLA